MTMDLNFANWRRYTFVEVPLALYLFAQTLTDTVVTDLVVFRSCQSIHSDEKNVCDVLHTRSNSSEALKLEAEAQPFATSILMWKSLVHGIVPALLSFFLGPWSDKYGRKPLLIAGYSGSALSFLVWTILSVSNVNPWFYLLTSVPSALMGGFCGVILASLCYITDIREDDDRAWHLTWLQAVISAGLFFGTLAGSVIFNEFGYATIFAVACACSCLATLYVIFFVPETIVATDSPEGCCNFFNVSLVKAMFATCMKKCDNFNRLIAWSCITCLSLNLLAMEGDIGITFLFASAKFGWDVNVYSSYQATLIFLAIVGTLGGGKFCRIFVDPNLSDMGIAIFANVSLFIGAMTKALVTKPWHLFLYTALAMFGGLSSPVLRAVLSKSGPPQDAGKIFSLTASMEAIVPLAATPLYTLVYTHSRPSTYPAPVFLVSASIFATIIILVIVIDREKRKCEISKYVSINEQIDSTS